MSIEELVVKHAGWIRYLAGWYCDNAYDADDLAGETIYKCLSQGARFNSARDFKPWARTIMENTYKTLYNRRKCVLFTPYDDFCPYPGGAHADQVASIGNLLRIIRKCNRKSCCIESVLLYAKGYSYKEISDLTGIPMGTVKSRVASGRKMLREAMG